MFDTKINLSAKDLARFAAHYWPNAERVERERWIFGEFCAFGGLASTVPELARFAVMHLEAGRDRATAPLNEKSLLEMRETVATFGTDEQRGVTAGWFFQNHPQAGRILYHGGEVDGHSAWLSLAPQVDMAIIVLANVGGNTAERLNGEVAMVVIKSML